MPLRSLAFEPVGITVVESQACHFCADAHQVLTELGTAYPLRIDTLDVRSEAGRALMTRHRAPMSPLVLLDGAFFSNGRLPRRKLERLLARRFSLAVAPGGGAVRPAAEGSRRG
jgi:hypothetical protein